jgi:hypothetical protein
MEKCEWKDNLALEEIKTSCGNTYWDRELYYCFKYCGWCGREIEFKKDINPPTKGEGE